MTNPTVLQGGYRLNNADDLNNNFGLLSSGGGMTAANSITAHAGGGQANATGLTAAINRVTVVATGADSVALPPAVGGQDIIVTNAAASSMQVFASPLGSDTINGTAGSTGVALAAGKTANFVSAGATFWHMLLSA